jgi:hypothetical protein
MTETERNPSPPHISVPPTLNLEQWRNVSGDLDDFIFYYEDASQKSDR